MIPPDKGGCAAQGRTHTISGELMPQRSTMPVAARRRLLARLAGLGAAGFLATFVAAPAALADDSAVPTDTSTGAGTPTDAGSSSTAPVAAPTDPTSAAASTSTSASSSSPSSSTPDLPSSSGAPSSSAPAAPSGGKAHTGAVTPQVTPAITPNFGAQKVRVNIQLSDPAKFAPGVSLAHSVIEADETGPNAPTGAPLTCMTDAAGDCPFHTPIGYYPLARADTVTFRQTTPPDGPGVLTDVAQVVGPCVIPTQVITINAKGANTQAAAAPTDYPDCGVLSQVPLGHAAPAVVTRGTFDVAVTFVDPPAPPDAVNDTATVHTGQGVDVPVLANDITYGDAATITSVTHPAHGIAVIVGSHVVYRPDPGFGGVDTFVYGIHTVSGDDTATVTVTVLAPPLARNDTATTTAGSPGAGVNIPVLANDSANGGSPLVLSFGSAAHGTLEFVGSDQIRYTPQGNFVGVDSFQYTISTPNGSSTATVFVTVTAPLGVGGLANTGVQPEQLGTIAALLLLGGGWASFSGRRTRTRRAH